MLPKGMMETGTATGTGTIHISTTIRSLSSSMAFGGDWIPGSIRTTLMTIIHLMPHGYNPYDYTYGYPYDYSSNPYDYYNYSPYNYDDQSPYAASGQSAANATVSAVQSELSKLGYYNGAIDGVLGDETEAALARYQQDQDISVSGTVNAATLQSLGIK